MPLGNQGPTEFAGPFTGAGIYRFVRGGISVAGQNEDGVAPCDTATLAPLDYVNRPVTSYSYAAPYHTIGFGGAAVGVNALVGLKVMVVKGHSYLAFATVVSNTANSLVAYDDVPSDWELTTDNLIDVFPFKLNIGNSGLCRVTARGTLTSGTLSPGDTIATAIAWVYDTQRRVWSILSTASGLPLLHGVEIDVSDQQYSILALQIVGVDMLPDLDKIEVEIQTARKFYS